MSPRIIAIIVTYRPDTQALGALLTSLVPQVSGVIIVDNTPRTDTNAEPWTVDLTSDSIRLIRLGENLGIARALNIGIDTARSEDAELVLFSDQDSVPSPDMVAGLAQAYAELTAQGCRVGAIGPTFKDLHTGITFPFQTIVPGKFFYGHRHATPTSPIIETLTLITSGCLVPVSVLDDVGGMREDLFIDQVDIEWCHRARSHGWHMYGTCLANMNHSMGDKALRVWYFGWRRESAYPPLRLYYRVRNFIALCRMREIDGRVKIRNAWYTLGLVYSQVIFGTQRLKGLAMALKGLWHGLLGRMGPYRSD